MNRRDFLKQMAIIGGGTTAFSLSGLPIKTFANSLLSINSLNGKILVIIQLKGGNDGLNTIIPYEDDLYYHNRPTLSISKNEVVPISDILGLHPNMASLKPIFEDGKFGIIQNVGYENQDRSHFRSTDVWLTASDIDKYYTDGWLGRALENQYPEYPKIIPEQPMAVEIGANQSLMLESQHGGMGVTFDDPTLFNDLLKDSSIYEEPIPDTLAGDELRFLKQVASQSIQYASVVKDHADKGKNSIEYPTTGASILPGRQIPLGTQLKVIAKLISGGLQTSVYVSSLWGFDTHAQQADDHAALLKEFADAVASFQKDLENQGLSDKVIIMTISEFGRRVAQNGGFGTDHGAAAPMMIFGDSVKGGIYGKQLDLTNLDSLGDLPHEYDFRQIYSTVMQDHLGIGSAAVSGILKRDFTKIPFLNTTTSVGDNLPFNFELLQNYPNPFNPNTVIKYSIPKATNVKLIIFDSIGRKIGTLVNKIQKPGIYTINFSVNEFGHTLASGLYIYQLKAGNFVSSKKMILLK